ncbi:bifunctional glycosyltransferase/CDP-glycerol:glycerophosphate glycerophosphotransferase [Staphylococcus americanisciuri]|uniref:CDP-glycerol:glycerophosphate glycerophosphotransferase n=1 Tax=Staphylococcus americanisciuri TaxID=2973940 RepID=A0ABT2F3U5_9STAP|nr:CDP-glycerol:glycerophosphate glycerophosphotransferase [Staphylococcus americanisciuri]MCS4487150.1 CDP-glycerol:glycerophosphate glycerophosphotransferase [Staphylococcus americanisciuri]
MEKEIKVTVVIPVFNAEEYIIETLESVENQTFKDDFEVLLINDGSEDQSVQLINNFIAKSTQKHIHYSVLDDGENKGQGARRNMGIDMARGEAILFLDSDDFIEKQTLEIAYKRLSGTKENDFVIFEWAYYYPETGQVKYVNKERYNLKLALYRNTVEMLLSCASYFTVNKLYKKEFLQKHHIRYGEGYIYEDLEFYVACALKAYRVPVISNILYKVRVHGQSTTKTDYLGTKHRDSFLRAVENASAKMLDGYRDPYTPYQVNKYFIYRALMYADRRLPNNNKMRNAFIRDIMKIINAYNPNIKVPHGVIPIYQYAFSKGVIKNLEVTKMKKLFRLHRKNKINFYQTREIEKANRRKKLKNRINNNYYLKPLIYNARRKVHARRNDKKAKEIQNYLDLTINPRNIIMLGFDYEYRGNSKYLFDYLMSHYSPENLKFVTFDIRVPEEYRIAPRSKQFFDYFYTAKVVIAESWIPAAFRKKEGQTWIQLWHGTPFKKMLFDSNESTMLSLNMGHKVKMKNDISRWDYLIADSEIAKQKFQTSFDVAESNLVTTGYPRNQWLKENQKNKLLIEQLKIKNNIPLNKKVILYAPTWRDYNYKKPESKKDKQYIMQFKKLLSHLGDEYCIINKAHSMDTQPSWNTGISQVYTVNDRVETQELIAISDLIVTDYSSIYFDAIHINKPFYFLLKDLSKFNITRGLYPDMYKDIQKLTANDEIALAKKIKANTFESFKVPEKYRIEQIEKANERIAHLIEKNSNE